MDVQSWKKLPSAILWMGFLIFLLSSAKAEKRKLHLTPEGIDISRAQEDFLYYLDDLNKRNYDSALIVAYDLLGQSTTLHYDYGIFTSKLELSYAYSKLGNIDSAMYYANTTLDIAESTNNIEWMVNAHKRIGNCYEASYNYEKAISHYIEGEKIARKNKLYALLIDIVNAKGILYRKNKDYAIAIDNFNSILEEFPDTVSAFTKFRTTNNLANVYFDRGQYNKAYEYFLKAQDFAIETGDSIHIALVFQNLGNTLYKLHKLTEAEEYTLKAIRYFEKVNDKATLEMLLRIAGSIEHKKKNYPEAEKYFSKALAIAKYSQNFHSIIANYHNRADNFYFWWKQKGQQEHLKKANVCLKWEIAYKDSISNNESNKRILELEKKYESEKKNNQIALLQKETEAQQNRQMFLFGGMIIMILLMGVLAVAFQYVRKTNGTLTKKNIRIEKQKQQIEEQNQQLETAINTQNKLFSIIAHDLRSPLASISNITILLKIALDEKNIELLKDLSGKLNQRNTQVLQLTDNLLNWASSQTNRLKFMPENYTLTSLIQESIALFEENLQQKGLTLQMNIPEEVSVFVDNISIKTVFRNLINNAIKFTAQGGEIQIGSYCEGQTAVVKITDTGIGISPEIQGILFEVTDKKKQVGTMGEKSSGLGLLVCKEFISHNQGKIWMESEVGKGTTFFVSLPLSRPQ